MEWCDELYPGDGAVEEGAVGGVGGVGDESASGAGAGAGAGGGVRVRDLAVVGGVAANQAVRASLRGLCEERSPEWRLVAPPPRLCTDNGVMVAWAAIEKVPQGSTPHAAHTTHDTPPSAHHTHHSPLTTHHSPLTTHHSPRPALCPSFTWAARTRSNQRIKRRTSVRGGHSALSRTMRRGSARVPSAVARSDRSAVAAFYTAHWRASLHASDRWRQAAGQTAGQSYRRGVAGAARYGRAPIGTDVATM